MQINTTSPENPINPGAATARLVPDLGMFVVLVPAHGHQSAAVLVFYVSKIKTSK